MKAHQRIIRERLASEDLRPVVPLSECAVQEINREQAEEVILKYEWLGTMPRIFQFGYGLFSEGEVLGAVCFGVGSGTRSKSSICGSKHAHLAACLERGACVHYAHEHAASHLISTACKHAAKDYGKRIFYAYSDSAAGEIGTIYQACNWIFLGINGRGGSKYRWEYIHPDGSVVNSRTMRKRIRASYGESDAPLREFWPELASIGWGRRRAYDRSRYVWFEGSKTEKRTLKKALLIEPKPYPKRKTAGS